MEGKYVIGIMAVFVSVILVGSVLAPVIDTVSGGSWDEEITTVYNEDPDLTFDKQTGNFALDMSVTIDGSDITIVNGEDTVTASYGVMFLLAADNSAVFINTTDDMILTWSDSDGSYSVNLEGDFTAAIADGKLTINDGTAHDVPLPVSYLYVPSSTGGYGSFPSGELAKRAADPVIAAGSFTGAVGYNGSVTLVGDAMTIDITGTDTEVTSVQWIKSPQAEPAVVPFDPSSITIQPLDPSIIDDPAAPMAVPTPTYTDGDWGYDLITSGDNQGKANIVSYSGAGGGPITIPATVGGYDVAEVGKGSGTVFPTTLNATDLIITNGIKKINAISFQGCTGFTGNLVIPDSVTFIDYQAFDGCTGFTGTLKLPNGLTSLEGSVFRDCTGFTGNLVIPDSITSIANYSFDGCTGFTGTLVIPDSVTTINKGAFRSTGFNSLIISADGNATINSSAFATTSNLKEILNLGTLELTTTSYGLTAEVIQDYIGADCYIAPATLTEVIHHSGGGGGGQGAMYAAIPIVILIAILLAAVSMFVIRRGM